MKFVRYIALAAVALVAIALVLLLRSPSEPADPESREAPGDLASADLNGDGVVFRDGMHPWIIEDEPGTCPICGMDLVATPVPSGDAVEVTREMARAIGLNTTRVAQRRLSRTVRTTGVFAANDQRVSVVAPKVGGWVERLYVNFEGARVTEGQPLMEIYSPELVAAQEEYLLALRNRERLQGAPDALRLVEAARRRLAFVDVTPQQVQLLEETGTPGRTLTIYASAAGTVTSTAVTEGQMFSAGETLMKVADLAELWLIVDVYERDLAWLSPGHMAVIHLPYDSGQTIEGTISYLYDYVDPDSRAARARIDVPNVHGRLLPGMYATVHLQAAADAPLPVVPLDAVISSGDRHHVLRVSGPWQYAPVEVTPGLQSSDLVQILSGLVAGDEVVTRAQFLIDSEARLTAMVSEAPAVYRINITAAGFEPARIELPLGVPARLIFVRHAERACDAGIEFPELGIGPVAAPLHEETSVDITADRAATYTFGCEPDALKGELVIDHAMQPSDTNDHAHH